MNISEVFIRRPIATALMMAGLFAFGAVSFNLLPVSALPSVDFPTISVSAQLPGASPDVMASTVATPLEEQFTAIPGLASMTSTSGLGSTSITLQFDLSRSIDGAASDVQTAINAASGLLPKDLPNPPTYRKTNPANSPVLIYAVHSDAFPIQELDQYANTLLAQSLSRVIGVGQVIVAGQQQPAVQVRLNPDALSARGLRILAGRDRHPERQRRPAEGQPRGPAPGISDRHQRPADQRRPVSPRHRRLQQRRARRIEGHRGRR